MADGTGAAPPRRIASPHPIVWLSAARLHDLVSPTGGHAGLVRAVARCPTSPLVWVQDALCRAEGGGVHARGLSGLGVDPSGVIAVRARRPIDALWAMEEALRAGLPVVGEIEGCPRALDFTATRRLEVRARAAGVGCLLVRVGPRARAHGGSGASRRWRVSPHPSAPDPHDPRAPGRPRWLLELTRARDRPPGAWVVEAAPDERDGGRPGGSGGDESGGDGGGGTGATHRLRVVAELADGGVAALGEPTPRRGGTGSVVPLRPGRAA